MSRRSTAAATAARSPRRRPVGPDVVLTDGALSSWPGRPPPTTGSAGGAGPTPLRGSPGEGYVPCTTSSAGDVTEEPGWYAGAAGDAGREGASTAPRGTVLPTGRLIVAGSAVLFERSVSTAVATASGPWAPAPFVGAWGAIGAPTRRAGVVSPLAACSAARMAAPRATAYLGCASTRVGRSIAAVIICATSGIREEPPTSSTALRSAGSTCADRSVRVSAPIVDSICARIMSSNSPRVSRTAKCRFGRNTGIVASVSIDSASFARIASCRSRASGDAGLRVAQVELAERAAGADVDVGEDGVVEVDPAEPLDALGAAEMSIPTVLIPARLRSTVASKVPPPRS